jgi:hypothetical protein
MDASPKVPGLGGEILFTGLLAAELIEATGKARAYTSTKHVLVTRRVYAKPLVHEIVEPRNGVRA